MPDEVAVSGTGPGAVPGSAFEIKVSPKSRLAALLFCLFLGGLGVHRFYVGKNGTGVLTIVTLFGVLGVWPFIDLIMIAIGGFTDKQGLPLKKWVP